VNEIAPNRFASQQYTLLVTNKRKNQSCGLFFGFRRSHEAVAWKNNT